MPRDIIYGNEKLFYPHSTNDIILFVKPYFTAYNDCSGFLSSGLFVVLQLDHMIYGIEFRYNYASIFV